MSIASSSLTAVVNKNDFHVSRTQRQGQETTMQTTKKFFKRMGDKVMDFCEHDLSMKEKRGTISIALSPSTLNGTPERQFHWDLVVSEGPETRSDMRGVRHRVKPHPTQSWVYDPMASRDVKNMPYLLARVIVAEVRNPDLADRIISSTPMRLEDPEWRCYDWVADALNKLAAAGCLDMGPIDAPSSVDRLMHIDADGNIIHTFDWSAIMTFARDYVESKVMHGRFTCYEDLDHPRPTFSMVTQEEIWG